MAGYERAISGATSLRRVPSWTASRAGRIRAGRSTDDMRIRRTSVCLAKNPISSTKLWKRLAQIAKPLTAR